MSIRRWLYIVIAAIFCALLEATFLTLLPSPWREFHPLLDIIILLIVLNRVQSACVYAGIAGFLMDSLRVEGGALAIMRYVLLALAISVISKTILTNRSLYVTTALVIMARCLDRLWLWIANLLSVPFLHEVVARQSWQSFFITIVWDVGLLSIVFLALNVFTRYFVVTAPSARRFYESI